MAYSLFFTFFTASAFVFAADPDPIQDFCIADLDSPLQINGGYQCKPYDKVTAEDFITQKLRYAKPATKPNTAVFTEVLIEHLPALNTAGLGLIRGDLGPGGVNVPHIHPRASELIIVLEGCVRIGMVDTKNKLYEQTMEEGDVIVIPRGIVHYQFNNGTNPASFLALFNSQNPGVQALTHAVFGSGIPHVVLHKAFQLDYATIARLENTFSGSETV